MKLRTRTQRLGELVRLGTASAERLSLEVELRRLRDQLRESEERGATLLTSAPEAIVLLDAESGYFIDANPAAEQLFGYPLERLRTLGPFDLSPEYQPEGPSHAIGKERIAAATRGGAPVFQWWHLNARGERIPCEVRLVRIPWGRSHILRGSIVDISEGKLLRLSESSLRQMLECLARDGDLPRLLTTLTQTIERLLAGMVCSILLLDRSTQRLRVAAAPSLPAFYNEAVDGLQIGPEVGCCGAAAFTGTRMIVKDVRGHPNWIAFAELAERAGIRACWSEPVLSPNRDVLGTFAMYYREPSEPSPVELRAIETAAQLTSLALESARVQLALREMNATLQRCVEEETRHLSEANARLQLAQQESRLSAVAFDTHDSIVITDTAGRILRVNQSFTKLTGYRAEEVIGSTPRILKSGLHGPEFYRAMWARIRKCGYWEGEVWNRRKDGQIYLQRLTIASVKDAAGKTTHYVGDGQDITATRQAEADRAALQAARTVQQSLFPEKPPGSAAYDIAGIVYPAEHVSGDFFDYISVGAGQLGVLVADVTGHGLGPSLLMAQTQAYLHSLAASHADPGALLTSVNQYCYRGNCDRFVTALLCHLDEESGTMRYAGAGHRGYLFRSDGRVQTLNSTSVPLGIFPDAVIPSAEPVSLHPGDIVLLPTDGIEEARDRNGEFMGQQRMLEIVHGCRHRSAAGIIEELIGAAVAFGQGSPPGDDITAVVVKHR